MPSLAPPPVKPLPSKQRKHGSHQSSGHSTTSSAGPQPQASAETSTSRPPPAEEQGSTSPQQRSFARVCTVLTSTPQTTTLAELLEYIPVLEYQLRRCQFLAITLLVTPSYAASVRYKSQLIEEHIRRLYSPEKGGRTGSTRDIHTLVAVVDRLPHASKPERAGTAVPSAEHGSEGIAMMISRHELDLPGILTDENVLRETKQHDVASSSQVAQSITFNLMSQQTYRRLDRPCGTSESLPQSFSVQIPLANTIFQNGLSSTLIHTKWTKSREESGLTLTKDYSRHLKQQAVRVPIHLVAQGSPNLSLTAPLVPLTEARRVEACMGNIVRRLSAGTLAPDKKDSILASQELEESVSAFFTARGIPAQTVSVWALVVPKRIFAKSMAEVLYPRDLTERWKNSSQGWIGSDSYLTPLSLLQSGARLHKVLSGGGGWGKKAGLLSLDPDSSYANNEPHSEEPFVFNNLSLEIGKQESALRDIVSPGDLIQFYISTNIATNTGQELVHLAERGQYHESAVFGTIPSTIDTMPVAVTNESSSTSSIELIHGHFGALSENGMALTVNQYSATAPRTSSSETVNQTKIDVPFSRLSLERMNLRKQTVESGDESSHNTLHENGFKDIDTENLFREFELEPEETETHTGEQEPAARGLSFTPTKPLQKGVSCAPTDSL
ncbi:hypothetical protein MBLNU459_g4120t1 [Dothideomycetes sp. NU459]